MQATGRRRSRSIIAAVIADMTIALASCLPYGQVDERGYGVQSAPVSPPPITGFFKPGELGPGTYTTNTNTGLSSYSPGR